MMRTTKPSEEAALIASYGKQWLCGYARFTKNLSPRTIRGYRIAYRLYVAYLVGLGIDKARLCFEHFNRAHLEGWVKWLREVRRCKPCTCNIRVSAIRSLVGYMASKDPACLALSHDVALMPMQKAPTAKVHGVSQEAIGALMRMPDTKTRTGRRDLTLMVLMYDTGARIDEVLSLKVGQMDLQAKRPRVTFIGKGVKIRTIDLLPRTVKHLKSYLAEFHRSPDEERLLFYSRYGDKTGKLTQQAIDMRLKKYAAMAHGTCPEIPLNFHAHILRHSRATHWLDEGYNIAQISLLLGHNSVQTTMRYLDVTLAQESEALATLEDGLEECWANGEDDALMSFLGIE